MATFSALHERMPRDVDQLHDFLWHDKKEGADALREKLQKNARDFDAFLRAQGKLRRNAESLAKAWGQPGAGESLFELLEHSWNLAAAVEHMHKREYATGGPMFEECQGAGGHAATVVESASIGLCANAGCFEFVEEWEGGKTDFDTYVSKLTGFLEGRGVARAAELRQMLFVARSPRTAWDATAGATEQRLAIQASITAAAWCALAAASIREQLGRPPMFSYHDYAAVVGKIIGRM